MTIKKQPIIPDLRIFEAEQVSREHGRATLKRLERDGVIRPRRTRTGRCFLTVDDAERLAEAL
jgi:predicted site-specific integrase-resolvase